MHINLLIITSAFLSGCFALPVPRLEDQRLSFRDDAHGRLFVENLDVVRRADEGEWKVVAKKAGRQQESTSRPSKPVAKPPQQRVASKPAQKPTPSPSSVKKEKDPGPTKPSWSQVVSNPPPAKPQQKTVQNIPRVNTNTAQKPAQPGAPQKASNDGGRKVGTDEVKQLQGTKPGVGDNTSSQLAKVSAGPNPSDPGPSKTTPEWRKKTPNSGPSTSSAKILEWRKNAGPLPPDPGSSMKTTATKKAGPMSSNPGSSKLSGGHVSRQQTDSGPMIYEETGPRVMWSRGAKEDLKKEGLTSMGTVGKWIPRETIWATFQTLTSQKLYILPISEETNKRKDCTLTWVCIKNRKTDGFGITSTRTSTAFSSSLTMDQAQCSTTSPLRAGIYLKVIIHHTSHQKNPKSGLSRN